MPQQKRKTSKKRRRIPEKSNIPKDLIPESYVPTQYIDNISLYEQENVDLLETIDGIEWDRDQFQQDFPHLAEELEDANLIYPMDAVRWEDEKSIGENSPHPEEPNLESLLLRSKDEGEAIEIVRYLEKQGEVSTSEAAKLISQIKSKGLEAVQRKLRKK